MSNFSMGTISGMGFAQAQVYTVHSTSAEGRIEGAAGQRRRAALLLAPPVLGSY